MYFIGYVTHETVDVWLIVDCPIFVVRSYASHREYHAHLNVHAAAHNNMGDNCRPVYAVIGAAMANHANSATIITRMSGTALFIS